MDTGKFYSVINENEAKIVSKEDENIFVLFTYKKVLSEKLKPYNAVAFKLKSEEGQGVCIYIEKETTKGLVVFETSEIHKKVIMLESSLLEHKISTINDYENIEKISRIIKDTVLEEIKNWNEYRLYFLTQKIEFVYKI